MSNIINVQLSYFCDYHIQTSVESITKLMEGLNGLGFGELLPSMIPGQKLNLLEGKAIPTTNLSFNSTDGSIQIVCMDNRIDCIIRPTVSEKIDLDKMQCIKYMRFILTNGQLFNVNNCDTNVLANIIKTFDKKDNISYIENELALDSGLVKKILIIIANKFSSVQTDKYFNYVK